MMFSQTQHLVPDSRKQNNDHRGFELGSASQTEGLIIPQFEYEYCSEKTLSAVLKHDFSFNGEHHSLGENIDWLSNPSPDVEWLILLHKFYYAPGLARKYADTGKMPYLDCFKNLVQSWIRQTPPGFIATDVTARRVQNWIYAYDLFTRYDANCFSNRFRETFLISLAEQVDFICNNMASARNHRTLELYAVFLASVAFPGLDTEKHWRELAVDGMSENIRTDLLPDGVHCELSTDYHHIVLRSYLLFFRLARLNKIGLPNDIANRICQALDFAMHIHRPDGKIPALSDSDSRSYCELLAWGAELFGRYDYAFVATAGAQGKSPARCHAIFKESGYAVLRSPWDNGEKFSDARYLVFDCGPVGAGNHGHLDALSVELSAYGKPLVVDPGRFSYDEQGEINWRARFRQTSAHNTITVDDRDQAIYRQRGHKRKIFDPRPVCTLAKSDLSHNMAYVHGFVESPNYHAVHHRHIWFADNRYWLIVDQIRDTKVHRYELRYQLTPAALGRLEWINHECAIQINSPGLSMLIAQESPDVIEEASYVSSQYGVKSDAPRICARANAIEHVFITLLYPTTDSVPRLQYRDANCFWVMTVDDNARHDVWRWDHLNQSIAFCSNEDMQVWKLPQTNCHG